MWNIEFQKSKYCFEFSWSVKTTLDLTEMTLKWPCAIVTGHGPASMVLVSHSLSGALTPAAFIMGCESEATLEPCESTLGHSLLLYTSQVLETSSSHWGLGTPLPRLMLTSSMLSALSLDAAILSCTVLPLGQGASQPRGQDLILFVFWGITLFSPFLLHEILLHVIFFFCELNVGKWRKTACPLIYHFKKKKKMATVRTQIKPVTFSDLLRSFRNGLLKQEWSVPFSLAVFHDDKT